MDDRRDVLDEVRRKYDELTDSQKRIAEAIVDDPEFVAFATVDKLAERLSVAPSTVVRFAYKLGLAGYPDLQDRVREIIRGQIRTSAGSGSADDSVGRHLDQSGAGASLRHDLDNLRRSIAALDDQLMSDAIRLLTTARNVFIVGSFASGLISSYLALALERIRGSAYLVETPGGRHTPSLLHGDDNDVMFVVSFPPYRSDIVELVGLVEERGVRTIALTDTPISPVGQRVDIALPVRVSGLSAQSSMVAPMALVNALVNGVMTQTPDAVERYDRLMLSMDRLNRYVLPTASADA
jgi:DNA-binding MurR/RpiR family transcriptional regulator